MPATTDLLDGRSELLAAQPSYIMAQEYYDGDVGEVFASPKARQLLQKAGAGVLDDINYAHIPVDTIADRLQIHAVMATVGDQTEEANEDDELAQQTIDHIRERNRLDLVESDLHRMVSTFGDAYLLVWPVYDEPEAAAVDEDDEDEPADGPPPTDKVLDVDIRLCSPESTRAIYDPEDNMVIAYVIRMWQISTDDPKKKINRANLYYPDRIERWATEPGLRGDNPKDWSPWNGDERGEPSEEYGNRPVLPNPTGQIPFFHFRNRMPYGCPEHKYAYGPQQLLNKLVISHAGTIDFQTFPQRYALVDPKADQVLGNLIDPDYPEDEDDDPESEQNRSVLKADPASVWKLFGITQTGQYAVADPDVFLKPYDRYVRAMAEVTGTPLHRFGSGFGQPPSGEALEIVDQPTNNTVTDRRKRYGGTYADAYEFALVLMGFEDPNVVVVWAPLKVARDLQSWQVIGAKIANGVPPRIALIEAGYMPDEVEKWLKEPGSIDMIRRVTLLTSFADAAQKLGAAAGLRVLSLDAAAKVLAAMLPPVVDGEEPEELEDGEQFAPDDVKLPDVDTPVTPPPPVPGQQPPGGPPPNGRQAQPAGRQRQTQ